MLSLTQSNIRPGNCWQTAVACVVGVPAEILPPQVEIESWPGAVLGGWRSYRNVLTGFLSKHFGCAYNEIRAPLFTSVRVAGPFAPYHVACGPTVRSEAAKAEGLIHSTHAIVACDGLPFWDVHPSRDGLTAIDSWGLIGIETTRDADYERAMRESKPGYRLVFDCLCPDCGLQEARDHVAAWREENPDG